MLHVLQFPGGDNSSQSDDTSDEELISPRRKVAPPRPPPPGSSHSRSPTNSPHPTPPGLIGVPTPVAWGGGPIPPRPGYPGGLPSRPPPVGFTGGPGYPGPGVGWDASPPPGTGYGGLLPPGRAPPRGGPGTSAPNVPDGSSYPRHNPKGTVNMDTTNNLLFQLMALDDVSLHALFFFLFGFARWRAMPF